jgi:hypothetical protein
MADALVSGQQIINSYALATPPRTVLECTPLYVLYPVPGYLVPRYEEGWGGSVWLLWAKPEHLGLEKKYR